MSNTTLPDSPARVMPKPSPRHPLVPAPQALAAVCAGRDRVAATSKQA
jgi:hypothetical protein